MTAFRVEPEHGRSPLKFFFSRSRGEVFFFAAQSRPGKKLHVRPRVLAAAAIGVAHGRRVGNTAAAVIVTVTVVTVTVAAASIFLFSAVSDNLATSGVFVVTSFADPAHTITPLTDRDVQCPW